MVRHSHHRRQRSHSLSSFQVEQPERLSLSEDSPLLEDPALTRSIASKQPRKPPRKSRSKSLSTRTTLEPTEEWLDFGDETRSRGSGDDSGIKGKGRSLSPRRRRNQEVTDSEEETAKDHSPPSTSTNRRRKRRPFSYPERSFVVQFSSAVQTIPHPNGIYASVNPSKLYYHKREIAQFKQQHKEDFHQFRGRQDPQDFVFFQLFWHCQDRAQEQAQQQTEQQQHPESSTLSMDPQLLQKVRNALKHNPHKIGLERFFFKATSKDKFRRRRSVWELLQEIQDRDFANPQWREELLQGTCAQLSAGSVLFAQYIAWGASGYHMVQPPDEDSTGHNVVEEIATDSGDHSRNKRR